MFDVEMKKLRDITPILASLDKSADLFPCLHDRSRTVR